MPVLMPLLYLLSSFRGASLARVSAAVDAVEGHVGTEIEAAVAPIREELLAARAERDAISAELATLRSALGIPDPAPTSTGASAPLQPGSPAPSVA